MTDEQDTIIRSIRPEWSKVLDEMILVNLTITRWRAKTRSEFNEYGLDASSFQAYTAGTRSLLPKKLQKELDTLEDMARSLLKRWSFKTLFGYLMPKDKYDEFKAYIEEKPATDLRRYLYGSKKSLDASWDEKSLKERWFQLAQHIAERRDAIVDEVVESYRPSAIVRWRVEQGLAKDAGVQPPDEWLDEILAEMVARIPTADQIRDSFTLQIIPAFVEAPDEAIKAAKLEEIEVQQREVERRLEEISREKVQAEKQAVWAEARAKAEKERLELQAERERLDREKRITQEIIEHEKRLKEERISKTLDEVAGQLHTLVYEAVCDGLEYLKDPQHESLHPRYVGRLKNLVDQVQVLNFTDDDELNRVCQDLEQMVEQGAASKDNTTRVRDLLKDVGISLKADLVTANIASRSARDLGIPDEPAPDLVRQARRQQTGPDLFDAAEETPEITRQQRSERTDLSQDPNAPAA
jgi:hypothetical protein